MDRHVAVVGAGVAGAGAAYRVGAESPSTTATVFERTGAVGGRMATRRRDGCVYDYAASYVTATGDERERLLREVGDVVAADGPVWVFEEDGGIEPGRDDQAAKLTGRDGLSGLVASLLEAAGADVRTGTPVEGLARTGEGWRLSTPDGRHDADAVVLTPPGGASADLLRGADWDDPLRERLADAADRIPFHAVDVAVLHYPFELERPWYALVHVGDDHDVGWLAREACKPGHVPPGEALLVVQTSPAWSMAHEPGAAVEAAPGMVADLLDDERLREPDWTDGARFERALPEHRVEPGVAERAARHGLHLAGDWVGGTGRTYAALSTGLDAGLRAVR